MMSDYDDHSNDTPDRFEYANGPTERGTFIGTCESCGIVWEFENYEVIPVPYPHGTCPKCHQWVAVF